MLHKYGYENIRAAYVLECPEALISLMNRHITSRLFFYIKLAEKRFWNISGKTYLKGIKITPIVKHHKVFSEVIPIAEKHEAWSNKLWGLMGTRWNQRDFW